MRLVASEFALVLAMVSTLSFAGCEHEGRLNRPVLMRFAAEQLTRGRTIPKIQDGQYQDKYSWRFRLDLGVLGTKPAPNFETDWQTSDKDSWRQGTYGAFCFDGTSSTSIFAICGADTVFDSSKPPVPVASVDPDQILVVEVANSNTHWMKPGDFDVDTMPRSVALRPEKGQKATISSRDRKGFLVAFADHTVWKLSYDVPHEVLEKFFRVSSVKEVDRDRDLASWRVEY